MSPYIMVTTAKRCISSIIFSAQRWLLEKGAWWRIISRESSCGLVISDFQFLQSFAVISLWQNVFSKSYDVKGVKWLVIVLKKLRSILKFYQSVIKYGRLIWPLRFSCVFYLLLHLLFSKVCLCTAAAPESVQPKPDRWLHTENATIAQLNEPFNWAVVFSQASQCVP